jgi:uncharacterized membrane protein YfcA
MLALALVLAVLVGVSLGLLGGGGSILTVPILRYVLGMDAHRAIAMSLLVVGATSAAALVPHAVAGRVRWRTGAVFGAAGMLGAYLAGHVARLIPPAVLLVSFALMMLATAVAMLRGRSRPAAAGAPRELPLVPVLLEGLGVGAVTGLVGAGGGFLVVPALVLLGGLPIEVAVGTSLLVIAMKSFAGLAGFVGHTAIDWKLGAAVAGAAIAGSVAGSLLSHRISPPALRSGFGWMVVAMAGFVFAQELPPLLGSTPSLLAATGTALGLLAAVALGMRVARRFTAPRKPAQNVGTVRVTDTLGDELR